MESLKKHIRDSIASRGRWYGTINNGVPCSILDIGPRRRSGRYIVKVGGTKKVRDVNKDEAIKAIEDEIVAYEESQK